MRTHSRLHGRPWEQSCLEPNGREVASVCGCGEDERQLGGNAPRYQPAQKTRQLKARPNSHYNLAVPIGGEAAVPRSSSIRRRCCRPVPEVGTRVSFGTCRAVRSVFGIRSEGDQAALSYGLPHELAAAARGPTRPAHNVSYHGEYRGHSGRVDPGSFTPSPSQIRT